MYNTINKNYRINLFTGDEHFGFKYSEGILDLNLNNITIIVVPKYNMEQLSFPPTEELYEIIGENPRNNDESRLVSFSKGYIILFEFPEKVNEIFKLSEFETINGRAIKFETIIFCISSANYQLLIQELPIILADYNINNTNGQWQRNDVIHYKSFQFIDNLLVQHAKELPDFARRSLEL
jgi:hypothetical protein